MNTPHPLKRRRRLVPMAVSCAVSCAVSGLASAQDRADVDRTQIIGNRELPKVLYIVPWKKPQPGDPVGRPPASVVDEALAPIDRDVFRRQLHYDAQLKSSSSPSPSAAPQGEKK